MKPLMCGTAVALALVAAASSQAGPVRPSTIPVHDLRMRANVYSALDALAEKYHVVIGVYGIHIGPGGHFVEISLKDGTLGQAFDAVVSAYPQFQWKETDSGAVHFTFRDAPLPLLDVTVHMFDVENLGRMETTGLLTQAPEVAAWLRDHRCSMDELVAGHIPEEWGKFAVHAKEAPLSAVFDEIAAKSGAYHWGVTVQRRTM